jgi:hypothetical protein
VITAAVQDTINQARRYADQETASPEADFTTDSGDYLTLFAISYRRLVDLIIASDAAELIAQRVDVLPSGGYPLPVDCYHVLAVERQDYDPSYWRTLELANFHERNFYRDTENPRYRVMNGPSAVPCVLLFPEAAAPGALRAWYVPLQTTYTLGDTYVTYGGWDDYVALDMAIAAVAKEDRDTAALRTAFDAAAKRVKQSCQSNALSTPEKIADVAHYPEQSYDVRQTRWGW